jgi:hypothetical protein
MSRHLKQPMTMADAATRLTNLARSHHAGILEHGEGDGQVLISIKELEAITVAAAVLGILVEALEATE